MPDETNNSEIKNWFYANANKILLGVATYFIGNMAYDFKSIKESLTQMLITQTILQERQNTFDVKFKEHIADQDKKNNYFEKKFEANDAQWKDFYQKYDKPALKQKTP